jgi:hypothetical protein
MAVLCECGCGQPAPIARQTDTKRGYVKGHPVRFAFGHGLRTQKAVAARVASLSQPRTAETRAKISASLTGRVQTMELRAKRKAIAQRASDSPVWVGTDASYNTVHNRARKVLPQECAMTDHTCRGLLEIALRHDAPPDLTRVSRKGHRFYTGEPAVGYMRLCRSHHRRYDA